MSKTIVITGAAGGIGHALSLEYARPGNHLILCDLNQKQLDRTSNMCKAYADNVTSIAFDLSKETEVNTAAETIRGHAKQIDRLILVGGVSQRGSAIKTPLEVDRKIMEINYFGHINFTKKLLPVLLASDDPHMGVTSSISGRFGFHQRSAYAASKFALHGFFESLRLEHHKDNLKVSIICPGRINTPISLSAITESGDKHGEMDPGQNTGMPAETCAIKMRKAIEKGRKDVLIGKKEILMVHFRKYLPFLFYNLANKINPR
ncbi:MAG TPA: SDR family NAD(P)-dependent oxidoreductase [Bacteroidales bacterium]|nr:SDR family NAD(P)-dependent oxidoreductase [Bacteroidales bacterium]